MLRFVSAIWERSHLLCFTGVLCVLLTGCQFAAVVAGTAAYENYKDEETNLLNRNYAAADYILQQSRSYYDRFTPITVMPLRDYDRPALTSELGRIIARQVGQRFEQLGYTMDYAHVPFRTPSIQTLDDALEKEKTGEIVIRGYYKRVRPDWLITLQIVEAQTDDVISSFEYLLPSDLNIYKMADPEIRIMRVEE